MIPVLVMIILHSGAGVEIAVNTDAITFLRNPEKGEHYSPNVQCQINLADGKFAAVKETCAEVRRLMEAK
jgi:hypothetical protein